MNSVRLECAYPPAVFPALQPRVPFRKGDAAALAIAIRKQDPYTRGHARRVALYALRTARELGLNAEEARLVGTGGLLHDIGKIAFSRQLLENRDSRLSQAMRTEIRLHPEIGFELLRAMHVEDQVLEGVRFHHERADGTGYPCGLKADEIPLIARIICVADCFDALTTDRSYQRGKSRDEALGILESLAGISIDAAVVAAFRTAALESRPRRSH